MEPWPADERDDGITDRPLPPWELPGNFRRDCEPHRASLLQGVARVAVAFAYAGVVPPFLGVPALAAVPLGLTTWALARHSSTPLGRPAAGGPGRPVHENRPRRQW